jgi:hypothetical protein
MAKTHTPGHAANHLCLVLMKDGLLFSGDHILNGSTTVIDPPDGEMNASNVASGQTFVDGTCRAHRGFDALGNLNASTDYFHPGVAIGRVAAWPALPDRAQAPHHSRATIPRSMARYPQTPRALCSRAPA